MRVKVFQATHPDMVVGLDTDKLRSHYLLRIPCSPAAKCG